MRSVFVEEERFLLINRGYSTKSQETNKQEKKSKGKNRENKNKSLLSLFFFFEDIIKRKGKKITNTIMESYVSNLEDEAWWCVTTVFPSKKKNENKQKREERRRMDNRCEQ